jgi:serine/threonine protein kinase/tetratricopeptide (TPR) repeat protein
VKAEATSTCQTCGARVPVGIDFCPVCALLRTGDHDSAPGEPLDSVSDPERISAERDPRLNVRRFENYEVTLDQDGNPIELGRGAMGITYKAFDSDLRFPVTLKVISEKYVGDESAKLRFLLEARAAAKVRHPNVASIFHLARSGEEYFYVMEFVEGETLESLIRRSGRLEVKLALGITSQVAAGLETVHEQKLVHRDIKPANIVVKLKDDGVTAKIIELGLAKGVTEGGSQSAMSTLGAFAGTPAFASPEQFAGLPLDIRSDLYSLGVTLWEMLAGQVPFSGSAAEVTYQHQYSPLPLEQLKGVPQPLVVLLEVLLKKDPAQRIQSPAELFKAIQLVRTAIDRERFVTSQDLRPSGQRLTAFRRVGRFPERAKTLFTTFRAFRVRSLVWFLVALLIAGAGMLAVNTFFQVRRLATGSLRTSSASVREPEKSIAVLPFESLSDNKGDTYFADGVQDEILSKLAELSQLKVISRTSVMAYRMPGNRDVRSIGTALGVAHLVEGTVRRDGNRVRITTELIDAQTDETLWSDSYQRDLTDIFAIQSQIAETVASKLSARLTPQEQKNIGQRPTTNLEAYDLYLQAKGLVTNWQSVERSDDLPKAIKLLEEATGKDPKFTLAYCLLARAHDNLYHYWVDKTPKRRALADEALQEALRLEPDRPDVHLAAAYHFYESYRDYQRAGVQIELVQNALPNNLEALWLAARIDRRLGRWEDASNALEKARTLDPLNLLVIKHLSLTYMVQNRRREADQTFRRLSEVTKYRAALDPSPSSRKDHRPGDSDRFWSALNSRDWTAAKQILDQHPTEGLLAGELAKVPIPRGCGEIWLAALQGKHPTTETGFGAARDELARRAEAYPDDVELLSGLGDIDAMLGRKQEAIQEATRAVELRPVSQDAEEGPFILGNLAEVYAWTNEPDLAFRTLNILAKVPAGLGNRASFEADPFLDPIRKDPRFEQLAAQLPE